MASGIGDNTSLIGDYGPGIGDAPAGGFPGGGYAADLESRVAVNLGVWRYIVL